MSLKGKILFEHWPSFSMRIPSARLWTRVGQGQAYSVVWSKGKHRTCRKYLRTFVLHGQQDPLQFKTARADRTDFGEGARKQNGRRARANNNKSGDHSTCSCRLSFGGVCPLVCPLQRQKGTLIHGYIVRIDPGTFFLPTIRSSLALKTKQKKTFDLLKVVQGYPIGTTFAEGGKLASQNGRSGRRP